MTVIQFPQRCLGCGKPENDCDCSHLHNCDCLTCRRTKKFIDELDLPVGISVDEFIMLWLKEVNK